MAAATAAVATNAAAVAGSASQQSTEGQREQDWAQHHDLDDVAAHVGDSLPRLGEGHADTCWLRNHGRSRGCAPDRFDLERTG